MKIDKHSFIKDTLVIPVQHLIHITSAAVLSWHGEGVPMVDDLRVVLAELVCGSAAVRHIPVDGGRRTADEPCENLQQESSS